MFLLVGLGNPGTQYSFTRHNLGFMLLDVLHGRHGFPAWQKKYDGHLSSGTIDGHKVHLLKPQTFMNLSGKSVLPAATFYKLKPESILVAHDELDIPLGESRFKQGGGDAGHNGLKSITAALGTNYHRLRLGIGRPVPPLDAATHVLQNFTREEEPALLKLLADEADALPARLATLAQTR